MKVQHFFETTTSTLSYIVWDESTLDAVIIDPVLDFDSVNLKFSEESIQELLAFVQSKGLHVSHVLETHIHADHVTGAARLRKILNAKLVVGSKVSLIQETFVKMLDLDTTLIHPEIFDVLLDDGEELQMGSLKVKALHTPGHTPACTSYLIEDALFTGDTLFMPDFGTGRCDFPNGSAETLFESVKQKVYTLPENTRIFVGHDYQPGGRELAFETTVAQCKTSNIHIKSNTEISDFLDYRTKRDATLSLPKLLFQSVQLNIAAGEMPKPGPSGFAQLHIPIVEA